MCVGLYKTTLEGETKTRCICAWAYFPPSDRSPMHYMRLSFGCTVTAKHNKHVRQGYALSGRTVTTDIHIFLRKNKHGRTVTADIHIFLRKNKHARTVEDTHAVTWV
jgi:hypothetical protein